MGVYLSSPIKEKISSDCENNRLRCGASSMQGWRVSQEDAHNCCLEYDDDISLFAVYDGHGGHEVAEYSAEKLPSFIKNTDAFKNGDYETSLKNAFLGFDESLKATEVLEELKKIAARSKDATSTLVDLDEDGDEAADNLEKLKEEAIMPISDVVAQYTGLMANKIPVKRRLEGETSKILSPFLKAKSSEVSTSSGISGTSDNQVSSSSETNLVNGLSEKNGVLENKACSGSGEQSSDAECSVSNSSQNGEVKDEKEDETKNVEEEGKKKEDETDQSGTPVKKMKSRLAKKTASLVASLLCADNSDESDSEEDESFQITETNASSDDDENGDQVEEEEEEEEEEDEEDDDDEDEEEEESEEEEAEDETDNEGGSEEPGLGSGCTAVVALVTKDEIFVANAGDSRAVLSRDGEAKDMSVDHKPEDEPEMKRITNAGGRVTDDGRVNGGLNLSRALGDHTYKQVDTLPATEQMIIALPDVRREKFDPEKDEFLVLACDGIWNSMSSQEVVDFVRPFIKAGEKLSTICEKLFDHCLAPDTLGDGTGCDNMTCVIVEFVNSKQGSQQKNKRCATPVEDSSPKRFKQEDEPA